MLKKLILVSFIIAIEAAVGRHPESDECTPASVFHIDCNECRCANDGKGAVCTRKFCLPGVHNDDNVMKMQSHYASKRSIDNELIIVDSEPDHCEYGKTYQINCNRCFCSKNGKLGCTRMRCVPSLKKRSINQDNYPELPESGCEFGKTYKKNCNTCFCGKLNVPVCTLLDCQLHKKINTSVEKLADRYEQGNACEPGKMFYSECNHCICNNKGKSAICTFRLCPPHQG